MTWCRKAQVYFVFVLLTAFIVRWGLFLYIYIRKF